MLASELIKKIQERIDEEGDLLLVGKHPAGYVVVEDVEIVKIRGAEGVEPVFNLLFIERDI